MPRPRGAYAPRGMGLGRCQFVGRQIVKDRQSWAYGIVCRIGVNSFQIFFSVATAVALRRQKNK